MSLYFIYTFNGILLTNLLKYSYTKYKGSISVFKIESLAKESIKQKIISFNPHRGNGWQTTTYDLAQLIIKSYIVAPVLLISKIFIYSIFLTVNTIEVSVSFRLTVHPI